MCTEFVSARKDAIDWLKKHYPALCEKSGLCERIGGRLYLRSTLQSSCPNTAHMAEHAAMKEQP